MYNLSKEIHLFTTMIRQFGDCVVNRTTPLQPKITITIPLMNILCILSGQQIYPYSVCYSNGENNISLPNN